MLCFDKSFANTAGTSVWLTQWFLTLAAHSNHLWTFKNTQMLGSNSYRYWIMGSGVGAGHGLFIKPHKCFYRHVGLRISDLIHYLAKNLRISYLLKEQLKEAKSLHKSYSESLEIKVELMSSLRSCCLGYPNIQIWPSDNEKARNKKPLEHGTKWNYEKPSVKCCGVWKDLFFLIDIFVIENRVMEIAAYFNLSAFPSDKNKIKGKGITLQMYLDLILFLQDRQIWGH